MKKITERTLIPISLVTIIIGGVLWLSDMHFQAYSNAQDIESIKVHLKSSTHKQTTLLMDIRDRISKIEGYLGK